MEKQLLAFHDEILTGISVLPFGCKPIYPHLPPLAIYFPLGPDLRGAWIAFAPS
jgi:hypothetical protein